MTGIRSANHNWKGGVHLSSHGYVKILLPKHHLSDSKGYAYEHRVVAEKKLCRPLKENELIHHLNGQKDDNREENIIVLETRSQHRTYHPVRNKSSRLNPVVFCECGCGGSFLKFDKCWRPRRYVSGHNMIRRKNG